MKLHIHTNGANVVQIKSDDGQVLKQLSIAEFARIHGRPVMLTIIPDVSAIEYDGKTLQFFGSDFSPLKMAVQDWQHGNELMATCDTYIKSLNVSPVAVDAQLVATFFKPTNVVA